ncbi:uncharacterized protein LOC134559406 [Prinia subflava]|uniref:uncharacterized protein LOC134559406 n=1 Tax=Prinia subflava TaxID=208062 RepID=UPI002FDFC77B
MRDTQHIGFMVLVYLCFSKSAAQNLIKPIRGQETEHTLLINEVNADSPGLDTAEFVELYHTSGQTAHLDGYYLVLYNGNGNRAYKVLNFRSKVTNSQGFFLIGSSSLNPAVVIPKNTIQNGPDAIALYYGKGNYITGMNVTSYGLVDALVHKTKKTDRADTLVKVLTPGREAFLEDSTFRAVDVSIERCRGADSQWIFQVAVPTPGTDNHCILTPELNSSAVLISEVLPSAQSGEFEFIELQGPHSTVLRDIVLVLMDGRTKDIYFTMDVYGQTSLNGLLLIGPAHSKAPVDLPFPKNITHPVLRCGPTAIALYRGHSSSFVPGKMLLETSLLDAFVYTSNEEPDLELLQTLTPGRPAFLEKWHQSGDVSMSQCNCCSVTRDSTTFIFSRPTPGTFNDCPSKRFSQTLSFCLYVADCQEWLLKQEDILLTLVQALDASSSVGVSAAYFREPNATCQDLGLVFTTLLTARSEEQLNSILLAFNTFLETPRVVNFDGRNITAERSCLRDMNVLNLPPGVPLEIPEGTPGPSVQLAKVTRVTPLRENFCSSSTVPNPPAVRISELCLASGPAHNCFVELEGKPGTSLRGLSLVFFSGKEGKAYANIPLQGTFGATGLLVFVLDGEHGHDGTNLTFKNISTTSEGSSTIAVYSTSGIPAGGKAMPENLVDALVYTCEPGTAEGHLGFLGLSYTVPCKGDRPMSLSRCGNASTGLQFALSEPSPSLPNSCPQHAFTMDLHLCFLTPNCSMWTPHHRRMLESLGRVLVNSLEGEHSCRVSDLYLQELNLTCVGSLVKVWGQVWAQQPEQEQSIKTCLQGFLASSHPFSVDGRVLKTSPECVTPKNMPFTSHSGASFQGWEIALFVMGSLLLLLLLVGLAFHFIKRRPQNYTNIEMNDFRQMAADF